MNHSSTTKDFTAQLAKTSQDRVLSKLSHLDLLDRDLEGLCLALSRQVDMSLSIIDSLQELAVLLRELE